MSNLRQIAIAVINYAGMNKGYLPTFYQHSSSGGADITPEDCYQVINGSTYYSYALLYKGKFLTNPEVFYCPSFPNRDFSYTDFPKPWLEAPLAPPNDSWRVSYLWNPHYKNALTSTGVIKKPAYLKLKDIPANRCMAIDILFDVNYIAHRINSAPRTSPWNLLFRDGHVSSITSTFCYDTMAQYGNVQKNFAPAGGKPGFDDYLDIMETEADGRDPRPKQINRVLHPPVRE
jgi:hypothetical protein